jgi:hypothetical protein
LELLFEAFVWARGREDSSEEEEELCPRSDSVESETGLLPFVSKLSDIYKSFIMKI